MTSRPYHPWRTFTVPQANACLPLVRCIVGDMVELARSMVERRQRLDRLTAGRDFSRDDVYSQELVQVETELEKDNERLQGFATELLQLGVEPKGALEGLVDFPSIREGRLVYLCWRYNEPEVLYWHDLEAGFAGRQPLVTETCTEPACGHDAQPAG